MKRFTAWLLLLCCMLGWASAESLSPTTGKPCANTAPIAVSISHTPANSKRSQPWGLQNADVVYESLLDAYGNTRLCAVFHDALANGVQVDVGPVRSVR